MKLSKLKKLKDNPRKIQDESMDKLCQSIKDNPDYFKARPLIVSTRTGDNVIIAGNQRYEAAKKLGLKDVPVYVMEDITEEQEREIIIRDNVNSGEWDIELLASWDIDELVKWDLDLPELSVDLIDSADVKESEPSSYDGIETSIVVGDVIEIGKHRLVCGDSTDVSQYDKFKGEKIDLVFTDPMYQDSCAPITSIFHSLDVDHFVVMATFKQCIDFITESAMRFRFDLVYNQVVPSSMMDKKIPYYLHKNIIYLTKGKETVFNCDNAKGVFSEAGYYPSVIEGAKNTSAEHGLSKNVEAIFKIMSGFAFNTVLDMFIGSGTTMAAAHQLGRTCYGIELDPKYCQVVIDRMKKLDDTLVVKINGDIHEC